MENSQGGAMKKHCGVKGGNNEVDRRAASKVIVGMN